MAAYSQLLINVVTIFLSKLFTTSKACLVFTWLNINLELLIIGCNQARYVSRSTCLSCLPPLEKSYASLGKWNHKTGLLSNQEN